MIVKIQYLFMVLLVCRDQAGQHTGWVIPGLLACLKK